MVTLFLFGCRGWEEMEVLYEIFIVKLLMAKVILFDTVQHYPTLPYAPFIHDNGVKKGILSYR